MIIYLKMQLLSLKSGGKLFYDGVEDDFCAELALDLDEDTENVKITVSFLQAQAAMPMPSKKSSPPRMQIMPLWRMSFPSLYKIYFSAIRTIRNFLTSWSWSS